MRLATILFLPLIMLGLLFFLAYIEDRHLTGRPRVRERGTPEAESTKRHPST